MTTRELIEAVREPERIKVNEWWKGGFMTVKADDYDALLAACKAVLDRLIDECLDVMASGRPTGSLDSAVAEASLLREKLR